MEGGGGEKVDDVKSVLVCRGGALGDFVVTLPVLAELRRRWPAARLDLLAYPRHAVLAQAGGLADGVRSLDEAGLAAWFDSSDRDLPAAEARYVAGYDRVYCLLHDPEGVVRGKLARVVGRGLACLTPLVTDTHAVDHFLKIVRDEAGAPMPGGAPHLCLPTEFIAAARRRWRSRGGPVILHPGSGSAAKNWPLERYLELARRLAAGTEFNPVFLLGEAEASMGSRLGVEFPVLAGLSVLEAAAVLATCELTVANDSGIAHLAAAGGARVVALFGPTDPFLWGPRGPRASVVRAVPPTAAGLASLTVERVWAASQAGPSDAA